MTWTSLKKLLAHVAMISIAEATGAVTPTTPITTKHVLLPALEAVLANLGQILAEPAQQK